MFSAAEIDAMEAALDAALQGPRGANPLVGAVVVGSDGQQLVTGYHRGAGTAHAEADAIAQAGMKGMDLAGSTMVVTPGTLQPLRPDRAVRPGNHRRRHRRRGVRRR